MVTRYHRPLPGLEPVEATRTRAEPHDVILHIEGLSTVDGTPLKEVRLEGVAPVEVQWGLVANTLEEAGIPRERAMRYADEMAEKVYKQELAHIIVERMTRVG